MFAAVVQRRGSISAEHGVGQQKSHVLRSTGARSDAELRVMAQLKRTLDPHNIMNPGRKIIAEIY